MPTLYDNFSQVRQYIDQHQGGGGDMSAYVTKDELSAQSYLTSIPSTYASYNGVYSYLHSMGIDKKSNGGCFIDSADITDSVLSGDIWINDVNTWELPTYAAISAMGYLTSIPSEYVTDTELSSALGDYYTMGEVDNEISSELRFYYTKTEINNASYATTTDLNNHLPYLGTLQAHYTNSEHFLPKANNTYYLGNRNFQWQLAYTYSLFTKDLYAYTAYLQDTSYTKSIVPAETAAYTLGDSSYMYNATYSTYLMNTSNAGFYASSNYTIHMILNAGNRYFWDTEKFSSASNNTRNLGSASLKWRSTYTTNLYADNAYISNYNNFIWTGTSAEYAALSDYTTYQLYLIKNE